MFAIRIFGLDTIQVDYISASPRAPITEDVYVRMPRDSEEVGKILESKICSMDYVIPKAT